MKPLSYSAAILLNAFSFPSSHAAPFDTIDLIPRQSNPLNPFLSIITNLPPVNLLVDGAAGGLTNLEGLLAPVVGGSINATDLEANKPCAAMTLVFARGTTEPGNMGVFVGPEFVQAIQGVMSGVAMNVQGVNYAASVQGYLEGGGSDGTTSMSQFMTQAATSCPNTKIIMSGYSQGGQVVHNTAKALPASVMQRVSAVVIFGDPQSQTPVQNAEDKTLVICHNGDNICSNGDLILPAHLTYAFDTPQAAAFVSKMVAASSGAGSRM